MSRAASGMSRVGGSGVLAAAAVAVGFAAADTYVVVLALPDMMTSVGLSVEELQRAAPIISGFLLGYVAVLPLIGRIADLRGRVPVLVGSLLVFAFGSLVTAAAYDLPSVVTGRLLQGVGGGGLVPATLALVADLYPAERRGVPLGVVGAVQELGSVLGPLYGAAVIALGGWRDIFWINLALGLVLAVVLVALRRRTGETTRRAGRPDLLGLPLVVLVLVSGVLVMQPPDRLVTDVTWGLAFLPVVGDGRWLSPLGLATVVLVAALVARCLTARRPLVDVRGWREVAGHIDLVSAALLSSALGGIVLAFATAEPEKQALSPQAPWYLGLAALCTVGFALRTRSTDHPLVPPRALARRPAWGGLAVSFFVGSALIAAVVDVPLFARLTIAVDSQATAALVLVRFLLAVPLGALVGGWLSQRVPVGALTAAAMTLSGLGFLGMTQWGDTSLDGLGSWLVLAATGFGFGLALAPVNAALLASTDDAVHGVASALLVVARMVGMLVGISVLTTIGLRRFYAEQADMPSPFEVCGAGVSRCAELTDLIQQAGIAQLQTIFTGAAVACDVAAVLGLVLLRGAPTSRSPGSVTPWP